jgi:hypothetical protein
MSIWDIVQQVQIENLKAGQASASSEVERAVIRGEVLQNQLTDRFERVVLVTEAMWELLSERLGLSMDDLAARVREVDARDGATDGKRGTPVGTPMIRCPACQAVVPLGKTSCQFCGIKVGEAKPDPFRV